MASPLKTTVTGRRAILKALIELGDAASQVAEDSIKENIKTFEIEIFRRAPVDSGSMKKRINSTVKRRPTYASAVVNTPPEAVFTEYGFMHKRSGKRIAAQPWIRPAFEAKSAEVEKAVLDDLSKGIDEAARRVAGDDNADA